MIVLGYDIGTSSVKVSLVDTSTGAVIYSAQAPEGEAPIISHKAGWAEQEPEMWWQELRRILSSLLQASQYRAQVQQQNSPLW